MSEHEKRRKRIDLDSELGLSRRDLLRRGAVVGGTLLWVAPAIQSIAPAAHAARQGPSPGLCSACYCWDEDSSGNVVKNKGTNDLFAPPAAGEFSSDDCENWCKWQAGYSGASNPPGAAGGPYQNYEYCSGNNTCVANVVVPGRPPGGVTCT